MVAVIPAAVMLNNFKSLQYSLQHMHFKKVSAHEYFITRTAIFSPRAFIIILIILIIIYSGEHAS